MSNASNIAADQHIYNLLIGSYTTNGTEGIYIFRFDAASGNATYLNRTPVGINNPTYLCITTDNRFVYAVNENEGMGSISAFAFDAHQGSINLLNTRPSGAGPCYISVDKQHQHVFAANYVSGSVHVFPINEDGLLAPAERILQEQGSGPNEERQDTSHIHAAMLSPNEEFLFYTDLGTDTLNIYRYQAAEAIVGGDKHAVVKVKPGDGPRHIAFSPDHRYLYLVTEMGGNIWVYENETNGQLSHRQTISMLPDDFTGEASGADIQVSPDGRFLYASNRDGLNEIVSYAVDQVNGTLTFLERQSSGGIEPRSFVIDPTGRYLLVANQKSNIIVSFSIDQDTGLITPTGHTISVDQPSCLVLAPVS